jgi:hypothetical protein
MTFMVNFGKWGGVYISRGYSFRVCLGWVAFTVIPRDIDELFDDILAKIDGMAK